VRSISDAGYRNSGGSSPLYRGEIHDLDLVGYGDPDLRGGEVTLRGNQSLLVIQSGALMPDQDMLDLLSPRFRIGILSGIPYDTVGATPDYQVAARRGGYDAILCYWGVLESARTDNAGKAASWVPIAGFFVHDEEQRVRIRLKLIVVDVATGDWAMLLPEAADDLRTSAFVSRESSDQEQVAALKRRGYAAASAALQQMVR
jgi:hypothetical protein